MIMAGSRTRTNVHWRLKPNSNVNNERGCHCKMSKQQSAETKEVEQKMRKRNILLGYRESNPGLLRNKSLLRSESQRCYRYTIPDSIVCGFRLVEIGAPRSTLCLTRMGCPRQQKDVDPRAKSKGFAICSAECVLLYGMPEEASIESLQSEGVAPKVLA